MKESHCICDIYIDVCVSGGNMTGVVAKRANWLTVDTESEDKGETAELGYFFILSSDPQIPGGGGSNKKVFV